MRLALSTHWNAKRHQTGERLVEEILFLGFDRIELSYDLTIDLVPGIRKMVESKAIAVDSVHNFSPVPVGVPYGHPELFLLTDRNERARQRAVQYTAKTIRFAAEVGASAVVVHCGRVDMRPLTHKLLRLCEQGRRFTPAYDKKKMKLMLRRDKKAQGNLDCLDRSLGELLPILEENKVRLAMENLPSWEAIPAEAEVESICARLNSPFVRYWHDIGHGQVRENMGFISQTVWLERLKPWLTGMHVHDAAQPAYDHLMPPQGEIDFSRFRNLMNSDTLLVVEPSPGAPATDVERGADHICAAWGLPARERKGTT